MFSIVLLTFRLILVLTQIHHEHSLRAQANQTTRPFQLRIFVS